MAEIVELARSKDQGPQFPATYLHFVRQGLCNLKPWSLQDTPATVARAPNFEEGAFATKQFKRETGCDFDVYLFARRQGQDDYAFFVVRDGRIEDKVISFHLSFEDKLEVAEPIRYEDVKDTFLDWVRNVLLDDIADWVEHH